VIVTSCRWAGLPIAAGNTQCVPVLLARDESREAAMRKQAERNWANGEKFNLMQAFQRQVGSPRHRWRALDPFWIMQRGLE
jgi:hypothetical protein